MPMPTNTGSSRLARQITLFIWGAIVVLIAWIKPYYGLMDDARNLYSILPKIHHQGFFSFTSEFMQADLTWGMFRPLYPAMVFGLYSFGTTFGPVLFFMINAVFVFALLYLTALAFEKWLGLPRWPLVLAMLAFPYTYDLFQHPSLQEKLIYLFGALALLAVPELRRTKFKDFALLSLMITLGFSSKTSFLIYTPLIFLALVSRTDWQDLKSRFLLIWTSLWMTGWVFALGRIAAHGQYTRSGYSASNILTNIQRLGVLFITTVSVLALVFQFQKNCSVGRQFWKKPESLRAGMPLGGLLAYQALFMPWVIAGYLLSLTSPFLAAILLQVSSAWSKRHQSIVTALLAGVALFLLYQRPYLMFHRLHDIENFIHTSSKLQAQGIKNIVVPCMEGRDSIRTYLRNHTEFNLPMESDSLNWGDTVIFSDRKMCPYLPTPRSASHDGCSEIIHMPSGAAGGFQVIGYQCGS